MFVSIIQSQIGLNGTVITLKRCSFFVFIQQIGMSFYLIQQIHHVKWNRDDVIALVLFSASG